MNTRFFRQAKEKEPNPYIGFTSFQHFNGERLYSDPIVRPENHMCETENLGVCCLQPLSGDDREAAACEDDLL